MVHSKYMALTVSLCMRVNTHTASLAYTLLTLLMYIMFVAMYVSISQYIQDFLNFFLQSGALFLSSQRLV